METRHEIIPTATGDFHVRADMAGSAMDTPYWNISTTKHSGDDIAMVRYTLPDGTTRLAHDEVLAEKEELAITVFNAHMVEARGQGGVLMVEWWRDETGDWSIRAGWDVDTQAWVIVADHDYATATVVPMDFRTGEAWGLDTFMVAHIPADVLAKVKEIAAHFIPCYGFPLIPWQAA
jgi:hypothetical protein